MMLRLMGSTSWTDVPLHGVTISVTRTYVTDDSRYHVAIDDGARVFRVGGEWTFRDAANFARMLAVRANHPTAGSEYR